MLWYEVLIPAVVVCILIRLDSLAIGPYWAFSEIVSGMGGTDVQWWYRRSTLRWAFTRRFLYVFLAGVALSLFNEDWTVVDIGIVGFVTAGLLLWRLVFDPLPLGVAKSDWQLVPLYGGVVVSFVSLACLGAVLVEFVREQSDGDIAGWAWQQAGVAVIFFILGLIGRAMFVGSYESLKEKKERRAESGYERP